MKNKILSLAVLAGFAFTFAACTDDIQDELITKTTTMSGSEEVPAVVTSGTASVSYTYNKTTKSLTYTATWANLNDSASAMHIHGLAVRGQNAGVFQSFTLNTVQRRKEGTYTGNLLIDGTSIKEADLLAGKYYLNLHSKSNPGGEIRAQLEF
jgi:hypothetical protein